MFRYGENIEIYSNNCSRFYIFYFPIPFQSCTHEDNSFDIIVDIIKYQRFFERVSESLKHFFVYELINENDITTPITTCDIVRVFCGILTNFININEGLVELLYDCGLVFDIIR